MKHQRQPLLKENTIECKHKSAPFSSFSLPDPYLVTISKNINRIWNKPLDIVECQDKW